MIRLPYTQVDAFAHRAFTGNPAAVMPLENWLDDATLLAIADEHHLSETAYTVPDASGEADFELRWFTPEVEVALCGHATLASGHVLLAAGHGDGGCIRFRTRQAGILEVARERDGYAMRLPAWGPAEQAMPEWAGALGAMPLEAHFHPHRYWLFRMADAAAVRALRPDFAALRATSNILVIATAPGDGDLGGADVVSRVFAPGAGIDEDPVTGSAHAVLTPYWCDRLGRDRFSAFQASRRGGRIGCRIDGESVILSGQCITVAEGTLFL